MSTRLSGAEQFNTWSHGIGAVLSWVGMLALVARAPDVPSRVAVAIFGASLVVCYTSSALYHAATPAGRAKDVLQQIDHLAIYLLIAGSYTPFAVTTLRDHAHGLPLLAVIWLLAGLGCGLALHPRGRRAGVPLYLVMGWMALLVARPLAAALPSPGFAWLIGGGVFYTLGVPFFWLDERHPAAHGVFHVFVLAGSLAHFLVVWWYVC